MKTKSNDSLMQKPFVRSALGTAAILLIPVLGQWPWGPGDFVIMGVLLMGTGLLIELVISKVKDTNQRATIVLAVLGVFFLIWAQLAVGLIGKGFMGLDCLANRGLAELVPCANDVRMERY